METSLEKIGHPLEQYCEDCSDWASYGNLCLTLESRTLSARCRILPTNLSAGATRVHCLRAPIQHQRQARSRACDPLLWASANWGQAGATIIAAEQAFGTGADEFDIIHSHWGIDGSLHSEHGLSRR